MLFLLLSKLNMLNFIWIKNNVSHPDFRYAVGNITYEETANFVPSCWFNGAPKSYQSLWSRRKPNQECTYKCKKYNGLPTAYSDYEMITEKLLREG